MFSTKINAFSKNIINKKIFSSPSIFLLKNSFSSKPNTFFRTFASKKNFDKPNPPASEPDYVEDASKTPSTLIFQAFGRNATSGHLMRIVQLISSKKLFLQLNSKVLFAFITGLDVWELYQQTLTFDNTVAEREKYEETKGEKLTKSFTRNIHVLTSANGTQYYFPFVRFAPVFKFEYAVEGKIYQGSFISLSPWTQPFFKGVPRVLYKKENPSQGIFDIKEERDAILFNTIPVFGFLVVCFLAFAKQVKSKTHIEKIVSKLERKHLSEITSKDGRNQFIKRK